MAYSQPGHINYMTERGQATGCLLKTFDSPAALNTFFAENTNLLVVSFAVDPATQFVTCLYTQQLTQEEMDDLTAWGQDMRTFMDKRQYEREKARALSEENKVKAEVEQRRLSDVGLKCEQNHGGLNRAILKAAQKEDKEVQSGKKKGRK